MVQFDPGEPTPPPENLSEEELHTKALQLADDYRSGTYVIRMPLTDNSDRAEINHRVSNDDDLTLEESESGVRLVLRTNDARKVVTVQSLAELVAGV